MRRHTFIIACLTGLFTAVAWAGQSAEDDTKALDNYLEAYVAAFNAHDAKAIAALYTEDADVVDTFGGRMKGRAEIEKVMAAYLAANPKVKMKIALVSRRFLKPDVVVEDGTWEESGHSQAGLPTKGLYTTVLVKQDGRWVGVCDRGMVPVGERKP